VVSVQEDKPWKVGAVFDDTGTPTTGRTRIGAFFQHANVADLDHVATLQYITSPDRPGDVTIAALNYRVPLPSFGDSVDLFGIHADVDSGVVSDLFDVRGSGTVVGVRYNQNLRPTASYEHRWIYGLENRRIDNRIGPVGGSPDLVPEVTVHPASIGYAATWSGEGRQLDFSGIGVRNIPGGGANARYAIFRFAANLVQALPADAQLRVAVDGQYTRNALVSGEQFGIGGQDSVRGFDERELTNDRGNRMTLELQTPNFGERIGPDTVSSPTKVGSGAITRCQAKSSRPTFRASAPACACRWRCRGACASTPHGSSREEECEHATTSDWTSASATRTDRARHCCALPIRPPGSLTMRAGRLFSKPTEDPMSLADRVQSILLKPKTTWPVIAAESADVASIYTGYVAILAAIPAIAAFIGLTLVGVGAFGVSYHMPIVTGVLRMVVGYVLSLVMVFVLALIVNALAPTFGGTKNQIQALKLVAYGSTAGFVGGIFSLIPSLSILGLLAALYSIYLIYTGIAVLMRCPPEKAGVYTAVVIVCAIVAGVILGALMAIFSPTSRVGLGGLASTGSGDNVTIKTPDGASVTINPGSMADIAKRMEAAGQRTQSAQNSGDPAAAGKAVGDMMAAMTGGSATPIAAADLKALLPESIGDMKRTSFETNGGQAMGISASSAKASYGNDDRHLNLSITDTGGLAGLATMAGWANMTMDKETDGKVEKVYKDGGRTLHEEYQKDGSRGEATVILANGVIVEAEGNHIDMDTLKKVLAGVDLGKIEAMKRAAK